MSIRTLISPISSIFAVNSRIAALHRLCAATGADAFKRRGMSRRSTPMGLRLGASSSSPKMGRGFAGSHACRMTGAGGLGGGGAVSSSAIAAIRAKGGGWNPRVSCRASVTKRAVPNRAHFTSSSFVSFATRGRGRGGFSSVFPFPLPLIITTTHVPREPRPRVVPVLDPSPVTRRIAVTRSESNSVPAPVHAKSHRNDDVEVSRPDASRDCHARRHRLPEWRRRAGRYYAFPGAPHRAQGTCCDSCS